MAKLIQSFPGQSSSGGPVTINLQGPTTPGNMLIVAVSVAGTANGTVSGITLGGSADNFIREAQQGPAGPADLEIWADPFCAGGQTQIVITVTGGTGTQNIIAIVMEWSGLTAGDKANGQFSGTAVTSFSSGATGTLSQPSEVAIGCVIAQALAEVITGPGAPWVTIGQENIGAAYQFQSGYAVLASTAPATYAGTFSASSSYVALVATFKATSALLLTDAQVPSFIAGYDPNWSDFDNWIQAPLGFLTKKPIFRAQCQASYTSTVNVGATPPFGSTFGDILEDPFGGWSTVATSQQPAFSWLCPPGCSGWYEITFNAWYANIGSTAAAVITNCSVSGQNLQNLSGDYGADGQAGGSGGTLPLPLMGGVDYVTFTLFSATHTLTGDNTPGQLATVEIAWIAGP